MVKFQGGYSPPAKFDKIMGRRFQSPDLLSRSTLHCFRDGAKIVQLSLRSKCRLCAWQGSDSPRCVAPVFDKPSRGRRPSTLTCPSVHFSKTWIAVAIVSGGPSWGLGQTSAHRKSFFQSLRRSPKWPSPSLHSPTLWLSLLTPSSSFLPFSMWVFWILKKIQPSFAWCNEIVMVIVFPDIYSFSEGTNSRFHPIMQTLDKELTLIRAYHCLEETWVHWPWLIIFFDRSSPLTSWKRITRTR